MKDSEVDQDYMLIWTCHQTVLIEDESAEHVRHVSKGNMNLGRLIEVDSSLVRAFMSSTIPTFQITSGRLAGTEVVRGAGGCVFHLRKNGAYLCAEPSSEQVQWNRSSANSWETFTFRTPRFVELYDGSDILTVGMRAYQLGNLRAAAESFELASRYPTNIVAQHYRQRVRAILTQTQGPAPTIVLHCGLRNMWEWDWLRYLLAEVWTDPVDDLEYDKFYCTMIVIESCPDYRSARYLHEAYRRGCQVMLIHLSDEQYRDNIKGYEWCNSVWRNYWSPALATQKRINFFPLGYKQGFLDDARDRPYSEREHIWGFAGDIKNSSRETMLSALTPIAIGRTHLTSGFGSASALDSKAYFEFMSSLVFSPCPAGAMNLDSFRVYESLEAGCIPIVERREGFDYFKNFFGPHPLPTVASWGEASILISDMLENQDVELIRRDCLQWWIAQRERFRKDIVRSVRGLCETRL